MLDLQRYVIREVAMMDQMEAELLSIYHDSQCTCQRKRVVKLLARLYIQRAKLLAWQSMQPKESNL